MNYNTGEIPDFRISMDGNGICTYKLINLFFRNPVIQASVNFHERKNYLISTNVEILKARIFNVLYFFKQLIWMENPSKLILNKRFLK